MSLFAKYFNHLLSEELINDATTWNTGLPQYHMSVFPKGSDLGDAKERHRKFIIKDPGFRKFARTVPKIHQADPTRINKVANPSASIGPRKLSEDELQQICKKYNISRLNPSNPKKIGNTGQVIKFDPSVRGYVIQ